MKGEHVKSGIFSATMCGVVTGDVIGFAGGIILTLVDFYVVAEFAKNSGDKIDTPKSPILRIASRTPMLGMSHSLSRYLLFRT